MNLSSQRARSGASVACGAIATTVAPGAATEKAAADAAAAATEGAAEAADASIPVYTIAFGTDGGTIVDPESGDVVPVPVRPADLELVAETTGGQAFEARTGDELVIVRLRRNATGMYDLDDIEWLVRVKEKSSSSKAAPAANP